MTLKRISLFLIFLISIILLFSCKNQTEKKYNSSSVSTTSSESQTVSLAESSIPSTSQQSSGTSSVATEKISKITGFPIEAAADPTLIQDVSFEYKAIPFEKELVGNIFFYAGRLYVDPNKFFNVFKEKYNLDKNVQYNFADNSFTQNNEKTKYSQPHKNINGQNYISLFDFSTSLDLFVEVNYNQNKIVFYQKINMQLPENKIGGEKQALLRLEDFSASNNGDDFFLKCRILATKLKKSGVVFSVAFIPKFVNPNQKINNEPSKDYSLLNIDFVYTLDYFLKSGAKIGLHGYTHQRNSEISGNGFEFGSKTSLKDTASKFESAIGVATRLNVPYAFFEFPHYNSTKEQCELAEKYFDVLYNPPFSDPKINIPFRKKSGDRSILYLSTPIDYLKNDSETELNVILNRIAKVPNGTLASMFIHPTIEINYIKVIKNEGYIDVDYPLTTPLSRILECFKDNNYHFVEPAAIK